MRLFKRKKLLFKKLVILVVILVLYYLVKLTGTYLSYVFKKNDHRLPEANQSEQIDEFCERNGDWYTLESSGGDNQFIYFKKSTSYYFTDINEIYLSFIRKSTSKISLDTFSLSISYTHENKLIKYEQLVDNYRLLLIKSIGSPTAYGLYAIRIRFELLHQLEQLVQEPYFKIAYRNLAMSVNFGDQKSGSLSLIISHSFNQSKINSTLLHSSLICSKTINIENEKEFNNLKRWIGLHNYIGAFENLFIYVNYARHDSDRFKFIRENPKGDLVHYRILTCIPSFTISTNGYNKYKYYRYYEDTGEDNSVCMVSNTLVNDLVLENLNKYAFMAVADLDEIIMPFRSNQLSFDSKNFREFFVNASHFDNFTQLRQSFGNSYLIGSSVDTHEDEIDFAAINENRPREEYSSQDYFR